MGDFLIRLLNQDSPRFHLFRACVAFVKAGGVLRLAPALKRFLERGGVVEIVAGIDEGITTRQALELLMQYTTVTYVFNNPVATFHPKVYLFEVPLTSAVAVVGSSNLTTGGLFTNYEANLAVELDLAKRTDKTIYESILGVFENAIDSKAGNARKLDRALLDDLTRSHRLVDEGHRKRRLFGKSISKGGSVLFPRTSVPPAPRIDPSIPFPIVETEPTAEQEADWQSPIEFSALDIFVMILGERDTRQRAGYSRDVFIPLVARDRYSGFWGWPDEFRQGRAKTVGGYLERRVNMLVRPVTGETQVVEGVRLYYYNVKHEFRLNCSRLVKGAKAGDLLLVRKTPKGMSLEGLNYEFEATVISSDDIRFQAFDRECSNRVKGSPKRWGYVS